MKNKYKYILFDADNTLFDFDHAELNGLKKTFLDFAYPYDESYPALYRQINQSLWQLHEIGELSISELVTLRFERFLSAIGVSHDPIEFNVKYLDNLADNAQLTDGALQLCKELSKSATLAIVTNGVSQSQHRRIDRSPLKQFFREIFVSGDIGYQKPEPEFFRFVFDKLEIHDLSGVLIVGDSLTSDIKGGNNAEIDTCWYNPKHEVNDKNVLVTLEIDSLMALKEMLK